MPNHLVPVVYVSVLEGELYLQAQGAELEGYVVLDV